MSQLELDALRVDYINLCKSVLQLKDYNTSLRVAILDIPDNVIKGEKKNLKLLQTLKRVKSLAKNGESTPLLEKKRKAESEPSDVPQAKQSGKKRGRPPRNKILDLGEESVSSHSVVENDISLNKTILADDFQ